MDENIQYLKDSTVEFKHEFTNHNLNNLGFSPKKHKGYSIRQAIDLLDVKLLRVVDGNQAKFIKKREK